MSIPESKKTEIKFTQRQGQYLAFIFYYTKINGRPPAEAEIQRYFGISSASTHQMIQGLAAKQLIKKVPGQARSVTVLIQQDQLPTDW